MSGLSVSGLGVRKGGTVILGGASFRAPAGALTGLIGPNGAGKSTLLAALLGLVASTGDAIFAGHDLRTLSRRERARRLAYVEQSAGTEERLSVEEVVSLGRIPFEAAWQARPDPDDRALVAAALADVGMAAFASRRYSTLSGGEQQRVQVARALAQQPRLLLLDEPTSHLDIRAQLHLLNLLRDKAGTGMTVFVALHDLNLAARFCQHLVVLKDGRVVAEGTPGTVLTPATLLDVYGVKARVLADPDPTRPLIVLDDAAP